MAATAASELECVGLEPAGEGRARVAPVRRNLFGPVDHQQLQQDFQRMLCMSVEAANRRWNFDFQSDRPAPGSVEWEELQCKDVPAFYRNCTVRVGGARHRAEAAAGIDAGSSAVAPGVGGGGEYLEVKARGVYRRAQAERRAAAIVGGKRKQAAITDFFAVKRQRFLYHKEPTRQ